MAQSLITVRFGSTVLVDVEKLCVSFAPLIALQNYCLNRLVTLDINFCSIHDIRQVCRFSKVEIIRKK